MTQPAPDHPDETDVEDITNVLLSEEDEAGSITLINRVEKSLARMPLARLTTVAPRTARWAIEAVLTEAGRIPGAPQIRMTAALAAQVAMDEAVVALARGGKDHELGVGKLGHWGSPSAEGAHGDRGPSTAPSPEAVPSGRRGKTPRRYSACSPSLKAASVIRFSSSA